MIDSLVLSVRVSSCISLASRDMVQAMQDAHAGVRLYPFRAKGASRDFHYFTGERRERMYPSLVSQTPLPSFLSHRVIKSWEVESGNEATCVLRLFVHVHVLCDKKLGSGVWERGYMYPAFVYTCTCAVCLVCVERPAVVALFCCSTLALPWLML